MVRRPALVIAALVLGLLLGVAPAAAGTAGKTRVQAQPARTVAPAPQPSPAALFEAGEIARLEKMSQKDVEAYLQKRRAEIAKMPRSQKRKFFDERRKAFNALPAAERESLNARAKKLGDAYAAAHQEEWAKNRAAAKEFEAAQHKKFMEQMPGIQRAVLQRYKELRKTYSKDYAWRTILDDARKGGRLKPLPE